MDDTRGCRCSKTIGMHMSHDIVTAPLLLDRCGLELGIFDSNMVFKLRDCFLRDLEAEFTFRFRQINP